MFKAIDRANYCVLDIRTACYVATKDRRGSIGAIAETYALNYTTLASKLNPAMDTHQLNVDDLVAILGYTKDTRILDSICAAHGNVGWFELPECADIGLAQILAVFGDVSQTVGNLSKSLFAALDDGKIDADELAMLEKQVATLHGVLQLLIVAIRVKAGV